MRMADRVRWLRVVKGGAGLVDAEPTGVARRASERSALEKKLSRIEQSLGQLCQRLERIDLKLDRILECMMRRPNDAV